MNCFGRKIFYFLFNLIQKLSPQTSGSIPLTFKNCSCIQLTLLAQPAIFGQLRGNCASVLASETWDFACPQKFGAITAFLCYIKGGDIGTVGLVLWRKKRNPWMCSAMAQHCPAWQQAAGRRSGVLSQAAWRENSLSISVIFSPHLTLPKWQFFNLSYPYLPWFLLQNYLLRLCYWEQ